MLKLASLSALAAAVLATAASSPLSAAQMTNLGHISVGRPMNNFSTNNIGASNQYFTPNTHGPKLKPKIPKPQTDQGGCHTKSNSIMRCWDGPQ